MDSSQKRITALAFSCVSLAPFVVNMAFWQIVDADFYDFVEPPITAKLLYGKIFRVVAMQHLNFQTKLRGSLKGADGDVSECCF